MASLCGAFFVRGVSAMFKTDGVLPAGVAGGRGAGCDGFAGGDGQAGPDFEAMLRRMAELLADELVRFEAAKAGQVGNGGGNALEGKAAVDLVSLMARTLEKIDQMMKAAREQRAAADEAKRAGELSADERDELAGRVAARIDEIIETQTQPRNRDGAGGGRRGHDPDDSEEALDA